MNVAQLNYTVRFLCPAFLGNADQSGQWRTPPFKALLRQWWRLAYAADYHFSVGPDDMRFVGGHLVRAVAAEEGCDGTRLLTRLDICETRRAKFWRSRG